MTRMSRVSLVSVMLLVVWPVGLDAQEAESVDDSSTPATVTAEPVEPAVETDPDTDSDSWTLQSLVVDYEVGPLWVIENEARYGEGGTLYTADEVGQSDNLIVAHRLSLEFPVVPRHTFILLYAPLDVTTRVTLDEDIVFRGTTFSEGTVVDHRYLFDGYRLSYLWGAVRSAIGIDFDFGASFQIRNANVSFSSADGSQFAKETDIGLVFALKARLRWDSPWGPFAVWDFDGFSTFGLFGDVTGGIYDTALTLGMPVLDGFDLVLRVRGVGGGADVPDRDIYNWAHFLSFTAGVRLDLAEIF